MASTFGLSFSQPNISDDKFQNLRNAIPEGDIVVHSGGSATINIFVESRYFFDKTTFGYYKTNTKKASLESQQFNRLLKLFLISSVNGKLISNDSPTVTALPGGGLPPKELLNRKP